MQRITAFFPEPTIYGPPEQDARAGGGWPRCQPTSTERNVSLKAMLQRPLLAPTRVG